MSSGGGGTNPVLQESVLIYTKGSIACCILHVLPVMSKSVGLKDLTPPPPPVDLTDKISFGLTKNYISAAYFIAWIDKIFKIIPMTGMSKKIST